MEVAAAICAGVVLVVIVSVLVRRRGGREAHSVEGYRQVLDVLGQVAGGEPGTRRHGPPRPGTPEVERREGAGAAGSGRSDGRMPARRDRSLHVMERPARRLGVPLALVLLLVVVGGGAAYLAVRTTRPSPPAKRAASGRSRRHTPTAKKRTPSTTVPPRYTAASSTPSSATYVPVTSTYSLTVGATTADCWMSVTSSSGTTVLAQTFAPGASASVSLTGHSVVLIGAPGAAKMSIDGVPVVLPTGVTGPYTVTLSPT